MKSAMSNTTYAKAASLLLLELAVTSTVAVHSPAASDRRRLEAVCTRVTPEHTALESIDDIALHTPFVMESSTSFTFELTNVSSMFTRFTMTLKGSIVTGLGDGLGDGLGLGFEGALVVVGVEGFVWRHAGVSSAQFPSPIPQRLGGLELQSMEAWDPHCNCVAMSLCVKYVQYPFAFK